MGEPGIAAVVRSLRMATSAAESGEPDWARDARCRTADPALFFGPNRFEPKRERLAREEQAIAICRSCPCMPACRQHAVEAGEAYGVWGGLGETDRRELMDLPYIQAG